MTRWTVVKKYDMLHTFVISYGDREKWLVKNHEILELLECVVGTTFKEVLNTIPTSFGESLQETILRATAQWCIERDEEHIVVEERVTPWIECDLDPYDPEQILYLSKRKYYKYFEEQLIGYISLWNAHKLENVLNDIERWGLLQWVKDKTQNFPNVPLEYLAEHGEPLRPGKFLNIFHRDKDTLNKNTLDLMGETLAIQLRRNGISKPQIEISDTPSEIYTMDGISHSCMKNQPDSFFAIYDDIPSCKIAYLMEGNHLVGRALLWDEVEVYKGDNYYVYIKLMDRIYFNSDRVRTIFQVWAEENGYWYKAEQSLNCYRFVNPEHGTIKEMNMLRVDTGFELKEGMYQHAPYLDTFPKLKIGDHYICSYWRGVPGEQVLLQNVAGAGGLLTYSYICCMCDNSFEQDEIVFHEGETYCHDCYCDNFETCHICNVTFPRDEITWGYFDGDEMCVCSGCLEDYTRSQTNEEHYWSNDRCMEGYDERGRAITLTPDDLEEYEECSICGELHHVNNTEEDRYGDRYCEECFENDVKDEDKH